LLTPATRYRRYIVRLVVAQNPSCAINTGRLLEFNTSWLKGDTSMSDPTGTYHPVHDKLRQLHMSTGLSAENIVLATFHVVKQDPEKYGATHLDIDDIVAVYRSCGFQPPQLLAWLNKVSPPELRNVQTLSTNLGPIRPADFDALVTMLRSIALALAGPVARIQPATHSGETSTQVSVPSLNVNTLVERIIAGIENRIPQGGAAQEIDINVLSERVVIGINNELAKGEPAQAIDTAALTSAQVEALQLGIEQASAAASDTARQTVVDTMRSLLEAIDNVPALTAQLFPEHPNIEKLIAAVDAVSNRLTAIEQHLTRADGESIQVELASADDLLKLIRTAVHAAVDERLGPVLAEHATETSTNGSGNGAHDPRDDDTSSSSTGIELPDNWDKWKDGSKGRFKSVNFPDADLPKNWPTLPRDRLQEILRG
jgi:hypothetical protein